VVKKLPLFGNKVVEISPLSPEKVVENPPLKSAKVVEISPLSEILLLYYNRVYTEFYRDARARAREEEA
jgi:hypothetical protein